MERSIEDKEIQAMKYNEERLKKIKE